MDLERALAQFDRTESNLRKIEAILADASEFTPSGIAFPGASPEGLRHSVLRRQYTDLIRALPAINDFRITAEPPSLEEIAQPRMDAFQASIPGGTDDIDNAIVRPAYEASEYRHRLERARAALSRDAARALMAKIDALLSLLVARYEPGPEPVADDVDWQTLVASEATIRRLLPVPDAGKARWGELQRHIHWAQAKDVHDIANLDWPSVRLDIERRLYTATEPLPVEVEDLGALASSAPSGPVTTALQWGQLDADGFERLIFNVLSNTMGYQNAQWLTATTAPDKGRDLSVERTRTDPLSGATNERVIVQCKHWLSKSIGPQEAKGAVTLAETWDPPFDAVIVATSGRFTTTAVEWIEKHNKRSRLTVEMWPDSHLELLLASRGYLVEELGLR